ncbi:MAG TPA: glycoside hydrolase family 32 protein [Bacillales bacterium]|nr:glycoside hydrolase family 32 protein [Bacillales bacterium]
MNRLEKAMESVKGAVSLAEKDPYKPDYHAAAPAFWINDPNGLIQVNGAYHLFYQHNPYEAKWGNIHWGHMKSTDLVHWEHLPIALAPDEQYDRDGCFSGSAVEHEGKIWLFYTGNRWLADDEDEEAVQTQNIAVSEDGVHFRKLPINPILEVPAEHGVSSHFRDPKVWPHEGKWYMVLGATREGNGKVLLYSSVNLLDWSFESVLTDSSDWEAYMLECPDFFTLGDKEVLLVSPQGVGPADQPDISGCFIGNLDYATGEYRHGDFAKIDEGLNFYAPQTFEDESGRRILIGWMRMENIAEADGWAGCMTVPRELVLDEDGRLLVKPVSELETLRQEHVSYKNVALAAGEKRTLAGISGDVGELKATFDLKNCTASSFGLALRVSDDGVERVTLSFDVASRTITFDRDAAGGGPKGKRSWTVDADRDTLTLHVFLDKSAIEVFTNDGERAMSSLVFANPANRAIQWEAEGGDVRVSAIDYWTLET